MAFEFTTLVSTHDAVAVWECPRSGHRALRALRPFQPGEVVVTIGIVSIQETKSRYTLQLDEQRHIRMTPAYCEYVNHHCNPNVYFDLDHGQLRAIRPIAIDDILSSFYPSHEWDMDEQFDCCCSDDRCIGRIAGAAHLTADVIQRYQFTPVIARLLRQKNGEAVRINDGPSSK